MARIWWLWVSCFPILLASWGRDDQKRVNKTEIWKRPTKSFILFYYPRQNSPSCSWWKHLGWLKLAIISCHSFIARCFTPQLTYHTLQLPCTDFSVLFVPFVWFSNTVVAKPWLNQFQDNLVANKTTFSSGIKALADYVHSKGLNLGIYADSGVPNMLVDNAWFTWSWKTRCQKLCFMGNWLLEVLMTTRDQL